MSSKDTVNYSITCVGICKEKQCRESAEKVTKGPVKVTNVICNSARKRQCEERVRQRQVDQIDGGGVGLVLSLADHIEDQTVATQADDENGSIENREEDHCNSLVHKHVTHRLVVSRGQRGIFSIHHHLCKKDRSVKKKTHKNAYKINRLVWHNSVCDMSKRMLNKENRQCSSMFSRINDLLSLLTANVKLNQRQSPCLRSLCV